jgi:hypothetical protein
MTNVGVDRWPRPQVARGEAKARTLPASPSERQELDEWLRHEFDAMR